MPRPPEWLSFDCAAATRFPAQLTKACFASACAASRRTAFRIRRAGIQPRRRDPRRQVLAGARSRAASAGGVQSSRKEKRMMPTCQVSITLAARAALSRRGAGAIAPPAFAPAGAAALLTEGSTDVGAVTTAAATVGADVEAERRGGPARIRRRGRASSAHAARSSRRDYGPTAASVAAVESWAAAQGLQRYERLGRRPARDADRLDTRALGSALGVSFERFRAPTAPSYVSSTGTAALPASLAEDVSAITGLSDLARGAWLTSRIAGRGAAGRHLSSELRPEGIVVAVRRVGVADGRRAEGVGDRGRRSEPAEGGPGDVREPLRAAERRPGTRSTSARRRAETEGDDEWDLDTQYSTGFAPGVTQVNVYDGSSIEDPARSSKRSTAG